MERGETATLEQYTSNKKQTTNSNQLNKYNYGTY